MKSLDKFIQLTFVVIIVAWVLVNGTQVGQVIAAAAGGYGKAVGALMPTPSGKR